MSMQDYPGICNQCVHGTTDWTWATLEEDSQEIWMCHLDRPYPLEGECCEWFTAFPREEQARMSKDAIAEVSWK